MDLNSIYAREAVIPLRMSSQVMVSTITDGDYVRVVKGKIVGKSKPVFENEYRYDVRLEDGSMLSNIEESKLKSV